MSRFGFGNSGQAGVPDLFVTDFSEYETGEQPYNWSFEYTAGTSLTAETIVGSLSGKGMLWSKVASGTQGVKWGRVPDTGSDVEILIRCRRKSALTSGQPVMYVYWQGAGSSVSPTGLRYGLAMIDSTNTGLAGRRYVSGSTTDIAMTPIGEVGAVDQWFWMRVRQEGTDIYASVWNDGDTEPVLALVDTNAANIIGDGWVGMQTTTGTPDVEVDFFGVGLNGRTVPAPS